jgi:DNA primase
MIEQATIDKIFDSVDIVDVIQDFVSLKKRGTNYLACCPFHDEKTPSFSVSPSKGIFKCFGCGKAGNAITFVQLHENISYVEALKFVAKKYGIEINERELTDEEKRQNDDRESVLITLAYAQQQFTNNLNETDEGKSIGLSYFKERGFLQSTINLFQLGYSLNNATSFVKTAFANGYKKEFLLKAGLCVERESGELLDFFVGRVLFPIHSVTGKVIAFGGRTLSTEKKVAKYKNSPESDVYVKNKTLYGLYFAKNAIVKKQKCYLVEGYTDVISLYQAGIENVVASCGTSLTVEQAKLIRRFSPEVTVMYDGDYAGIHASLRGIDILLEEGLNVKVILFPDNEDPDSFVRKHSISETEDFLNNNEQDFITFKTNLLLGESKNDPVKKAKIIGEIIQSVSVIPDNLTQMLYVKECSKLFDVEENTLIQELKRIRAKKYYGKEYKEIQPLITEKQKQQIDIISADKNNCNAEERELAYFLLKHGNRPLFENSKGNIDTVAQYIISELKENDIELQNDCYKRVFEQYENLLSKNSDFSIKHFINNIDKQISEFAVNIISDEYELSEIWNRYGSNISPEEDELKHTIPRAITVYKIKILAQTIDKFKTELNSSIAENDTELTVLITKKIMELNKARSMLSRQLKRVVS